MISSTLRNPYPAWFVALITVLAGLGVVIWGDLWKGAVLIAFGTLMAIWAVARHQ
jgi:hypothetical protein